MAANAREWLRDIERREKAIKKAWRDEADKIVQIYEADEKEAVPFNILYSNTETLLPALYNSTPRPEVARRFTVPGPEKALDVALASTGERILEYTADSNVSEYETFDAATRGAVLAALVPGAGISRVRYHADGGYQEICFEDVPYDNFVWAYARRWQDVPWVAYGYDLIQPDFERQFPEFCKSKKYKEYKWTTEDDEESPEEAAKREDAGTNKQASVRVWEVWAAHEKMVRFVCDDFKDEYVKEEPYPFELTARFPSPEPLRLIKRVNNLMPVPPYRLYESQARELNELTKRLKLVVKAIKVRGAYNAQMTEIASVLTSDDTALVPVENASAMMESGGFEKHIWMMPIQELIQTAKELYAAREQVKATIYEIMGIGDILRGASNASETAKAQEIKNQWGSLRVKRMQKDVQLYCRELFRIAFEFAANLYTPATLQQITKMPYLLNAQKQQFQMQMQMAMQQAQMAGQEPPQPPPEMMMLMNAPSWEDISAKLQDQYERTYRIDVETNSTVDLEATEDKAQIAEFMNAWGQMMSGLQPMIESGAMPFEAGKVIMGEVFRRFRFARRVEQALDLIQQPPPKEDDKAIKEKHAAEMAKVQAEGKRQIGEMQESMIEATSQIEQLKIENAALKKSLEIQAAATDLDVKGMEIQGRQTEHAIKTDYQGKLQMKDQQIGAERQQLAGEKQALDGERQMMQMKSAESDLANMFKDHLMQVDQRFQQMQQMHQQMQEEDDEEEDDGMDEELKAAIQALLAAQTQTQKSIQELTKIVSADRETEIEVGKDGKKRGRSRLVLQ